MLEIKNIHKSFGSLEVLKGVSLSVKQGEVISIVGASGAGKTTLLQIMGTLMPFDKGSIEIDGVEPAGLREDNLATFRNQNIGFVFQFHHLLPEFNAFENVCIPSLIANKRKKDVEEEAKSLLAFLGLSNRIHHKPSELSGGEQQRVAVARALINKPKVVLADEPSGNLDSHTKRELHELFFKLREKYNQTFVIVTHDKELAEMSDRKIVMADGLVQKLN